MQKSQHHEEINGAMNVKELSMVCSVMNELFKRGNVSNTSRAVLKPVEDSLSNEEDDDDDLIINVVSNANNRATMSGSREQEKISTEVQFHVQLLCNSLFFRVY